MKKVLLCSVLYILSVSSLFAVTLPSGVEGNVTDIKQVNGKIISAVLSDLTTINTNYGQIGVIGKIEFYENGRFKTIQPKDSFSFKTPSGILCNSVKDFIKTVEFYENGNIKSIYVIDNTEIQTKNGSISIKKQSLELSEQGYVKEVTIWKNTQIQTSFGPLEVQKLTVLSFYDSGSVKSLHPAKMIPIKTSLGEFTPPNGTEVVFLEDGSIKALTVPKNTSIVVPFGKVMLKNNSEIEFFKNGKIARFSPKEICEISIDGKKNFSQSGKEIIYYSNGNIQEFSTKQGEVFTKKATITYNSDLFGATVKCNEKGSIIEVSSLGTLSFTLGNSTFSGTSISFDNAGNLSQIKGNLTGVSIAFADNDKQNGLTIAFSSDNSTFCLATGDTATVYRNTSGNWSAVRSCSGTFGQDSEFFFESNELTAFTEKIFSSEKAANEYVKRQVK